jgi:hypothetical protein
MPGGSQPGATGYGREEFSANATGSEVKSGMMRASAQCRRKGKIMRRTTLLLGPIAIFTLTSAYGEILWAQPPVDSFGGLSSQDARNPGGLGWFSEVADNFAGQSGWSIDRVEFHGGYATPLG